MYVSKGCSSSASSGDQQRRARSKSKARPHRSPFCNLHCTSAEASPRPSKQRTVSPAGHLCDLRRLPARFRQDCCPTARFDRGIFSGRAAYIFHAAAGTVLSSGDRCTREPQDDANFFLITKVPLRHFRTWPRKLDLIDSRSKHASRNTRRIPSRRRRQVVAMVCIHVPHAVTYACIFFFVLSVH